MNFYRSLLILIIAISSNANAFQPKIEIIEQFDELKMIAFINQEDMHSNPEWNANLDTIPLTVNSAIQAVKTFSKTIEPINEIEIRTVPNHKNKWHYLIKTTNEKMKSKYAIYVVLMNGKVIPAIIEPQGYK
jgi:hypothetical protein